MTAAGRTPAAVALGSNLGDRLAHLQAAVEALEALRGVAVAAASPVYETEAHVQPGQAAQPDHLNAVVRLAVEGTPWGLLRRMQQIERAAGRASHAPRWSARPLDLDLVLFGPAHIDEPGLTLPHPRLAERRFVLAPLADIWPDAVVPGWNLTVRELLAATTDTARLHRTEWALR